MTNQMGPLHIFLTNILRWNRQCVGLRRHVRSVVVTSLANPSWDLNALALTFLQLKNNKRLLGIDEVIRNQSQKFKPFVELALKMFSRNPKKHEWRHNPHKIQDEKNRVKPSNKFASLLIQYLQLATLTRHKQLQRPVWPAEWPGPVSRGGWLLATQFRLRLQSPRVNPSRHPVTWTGTDLLMLAWTPDFVFYYPQDDNTKSRKKWIFKSTIIFILFINQFIFSAFWNEWF